MCRMIQNPLPRKLGRMIVDKSPPNMGPPLAKDIVTIGISEDVDFYILIGEIENNLIKGEIVGIGPNPVEEYEEWKRGDKVQFSEEVIRAIIRND